MFSVLCLAVCLGLLAGCANKTGRETDEGLLSAVASVKDYLGGSLYQVEPMSDQETLDPDSVLYDVSSEQEATQQPSDSAAVNPMTSVSQEELFHATGLSLHAPVDASDAAWFVIDTGEGEKMAQLSFSWRDKSFVYCAQPTSSKKLF